MTPPHGDPVGDAALEHSATVAESAPVPESPVSESPTTAAAVVSETPSAEPLYFGPVEPAPAGDLSLDSEPDNGRAAESAGLAGEEPAVSPTHAEPEPLYAGPVEAAPAGLGFAAPEGEATETGQRGQTGGPVTLTQPEVHDDLEAAALASSAVAPEAEPAGEEDEPLETGPNWMLAFICAWSSAIALREAWATVGGGGLGPALHNLGVMGYLFLGVGLLAYAFDALQWGRPRRGLAPLVLPTLLTLAGVVCLVLWNNPGRPI